MPRASVGTPRSRLEVALEARGISILHLAKALGVQYSNVWRVAAGRSAMTRARAERYAAALKSLGAKAKWQDII